MVDQRQIIAAVALSVIVLVCIGLVFTDTTSPSPPPSTTPQASLVKESLKLHTLPLVNVYAQKRVLLIVGSVFVGLLVLAGLCVGGYFLYLHFSAPVPAPVEETVITAEDPDPVQVKEEELIFGRFTANQFYFKLVPMAVGLFVGSLAAGVPYLARYFSCQFDKDKDYYVHFAATVLMAVVSVGAAIWTGSFWCFVGIFASVFAPIAFTKALVAHKHEETRSAGSGSLGMLILSLLFMVLGYVL